MALALCALYVIVLAYPVNTFATLRDMIHRCIDKLDATQSIPFG